MTSYPSKRGRRHKFVIYAPDYCERVGGNLILHYLCHYLNKSGYQAFIYLMSDEFSDKKRSVGLKGKLSTMRMTIRRKLRGDERVSSVLNTPVASESDLEHAIVVYPEVVNGNPLQAGRVVRYFLHKPGYHTGKVEYGDNELYFYFQNVFDIHSLGSSANKELFFSVILRDVFKQTNFGKRSGSCYILRKGRKRPLFHNIANSTIVDELSHKEMAKIFNESEYCISYDTQTFYSYYAAACGCKSIVIPEPGVTKDEWRAKEELRYGVAYGEEDLEWAIGTRSKMLEFLQREQQIAQVKVGGFAEDCARFFDA